MDTESNQMESVRRLIALKRYEQPPPGYFHLLPSRIITRIENGEGEASFWESWLDNFSVRPVWACAFGLSLCAAVTAAVVYPAKSDAPIASSQPASPGELWADAAPAADEAAVANGTSQGLHVANWLGSTSPVTVGAAASASFDSQEALAVPVSFYRGE